MVTSITKDSETFTFTDAMINRISSSSTTEIDENIMPGGGPLVNYGIDINGVAKVITIEGQLLDASSTVSDTQNIRSMEVMKLWLEGLQDGAQTVFNFRSNREKFSVSGAGTSTITDAVSGEVIELTASFGTTNLDASSGTTKVYIKSITFDDVEGSPEEIPFTLQLWVAGT